MCRSTTLHLIALIVATLAVVQHVDASRELERRSVVIKDAWSQVTTVLKVIEDVTAKLQSGSGVVVGADAADGAAAAGHKMHEQQFTLPPGFTLPSNGGFTPPPMPSIPASCLSLLTKFNPPPMPSAICTLWSDVSTCAADLLSQPAVIALLPTGFPTNIISLIQPLIDGICATVDGRACSSVFEAIVNVSTCSGTVVVGGAASTSCAPQCNLVISQDSFSSAISYRCEPTLNTRVVTDMCHGCFLSIVNGAVTVLTNIRGLQSFINTISTDIDLGDISGPLVNSLLGMRNALCPKTPSGALCVVQLGFVGPAGSTLVDGISAVEGASTAGLLSLGGLMNTVCMSTDNQICFNRIVLGVVAASAIDASLAIKKCRGQGNDDCSAYIQASQAAKVAAWGVRTARLCSTNNLGQLCLSLPAIANATVPGFSSCVATLYSVYTPPYCSAVLNTSTATWGCCGRVIVNSDPMIIRNNVAGPIVAAFPPACVIPLAGSPIAKVLKLTVLWSLIANNASLYNATLNAAVNDVAARLGISIDFIINARLVSAAAATSAPASLHRSFMLLQAAGNGGTTNMDFSIQTTNSSMTAAASSQFDQDVANNDMPLYSTNAELQAAGALQPGQSSTPTTAPAAPSAPAGPSIALIAGIAGAVVGVLIIIVVVIVVTRRPAGASRAAQGEDPNALYRPMTV